jgi:hypothetical protein
MDISPSGKPSATNEEYEEEDRFTDWGIKNNASISDVCGERSQGEVGEKNEASMALCWPLPTLCRCGTGASTRGMKLEGRCVRSTHGCPVARTMVIDMKPKSGPE